MNVFKSFKIEKILSFLFVGNFWCVFFFLNNDFLFFVELFSKNKEFPKDHSFFKIFYSKWRKLALKKIRKIFPFWLTYLYWLQEGIGFIFSILWGKWIGYGQQDDLAKFGYEIWLMIPKFWDLRCMRYWILSSFFFIGNSIKLRPKMILKRKN